VSSDEPPPYGPEKTARIARKDVLKGLPHRIVVNLQILSSSGSALC
jgi:hypothetical protein